MGSTDRKLLSLGIVGVFSIVLTGCGSGENGADGGGSEGTLAPAGDAEADTAAIWVDVNTPAGIVARKKLQCEGPKNDLSSTTTIIAEDGGPARSAGENPHTLEFTAGALSEDAVVYITDDAHKKHLKVRIGTDPRDVSVSTPASLTIDMTRCAGTLPTDVSLIREDDMSDAGESTVVDSKATFKISDFSTYVLAVPRRGLVVDTTAGVSADTTAR